MRQHVNLARPRIVVHHYRKVDCIRNCLVMLVYSLLVRFVVERWNNKGAISTRVLRVPGEVHCVFCGTCCSSSEKRDPSIDLIHCRINDFPMFFGGEGCKLAGATSNNYSVNRTFNKMLNNT